MTQDQLLQSQLVTSQMGSLGEQFALTFEHKRLPEFLHGKIVHFEDHEIALGYDILSFEAPTSIIPDRYIEVKTFRGHPHFYWTENEIAAAHKYGEHYYLYLVDIDRVGDSGYEPQIIPNPAVLFNEGSSWTHQVRQYAFSLNAETNIPQDWDTSTILLGCYNTEEHLRWILDHNLYNVRAGKDFPGAVSLSNPQVRQAKYLVLYCVSNPRVYMLYRLDSHPYKACKTEMQALGYTNPHAFSYILHPICERLHTFHLDLAPLLREVNHQGDNTYGTPLYLTGIQLRRIMALNPEISNMMDLHNKHVPYSLPEIPISNEFPSQDIIQTLYNLLSTTPENLSDTEISQILDILPSLENWIKEFKQQAVCYSHDTGAILPGYLLKEYHRRTISDKTAVIEAIRTFNPELAQKCLRPQELCTLAQLEKILGQHLFEKLLTPHITIDTSFRLVHEK